MDGAVATLTFSYLITNGYLPAEVETSDGTQQVSFDDCELLIVDETHSTVQAAYAVHEDNGVLHAHVALTGRRSDLFMDADDISQARDYLEQRLEPDLGPAPELEKQIELEQERKQRLEQGPKHEWERAEEQSLDLEPELEQEQEQQQEQDRDRGQGYDIF